MRKTVVHFPPPTKTIPKIPKFPIQNSKITTKVEGKHNWKGKRVREPIKP
jgi:hypothetical protein